MDRASETTEVAMTAPHVVWELDAALGEGPVWFPTEGVLRFVDIKRGRIHCFDPSAGSGSTIDVGGKPSFLFGIDGGGILVGSEHGLYRLEKEKLGERLAIIDQPDQNRTNDATVDNKGRLWFGTMDDNERDATGQIWCYSVGDLRCIGGTAVVTNGPAVSVDSRCLYRVDSVDRTIWRHQLDGSTTGPGEVFVRISEPDGHPDGIVVDSENCLWVALWDGWAVRRYSPAGELLLQVDLPCARVTKLAFGGPDLTTAFVTTARVGLDGASLASQPLAGSLFCFTAPVAGNRTPEIRL